SPPPRRERCVLGPRDASTRANRRPAPTADPPAARVPSPTEPDPSSSNASFTSLREDDDENRDVVGVSAVAHKRGHIVLPPCGWAGWRAVRARCPTPLLM